MRDTQTFVTELLRQYHGRRKNTGARSLPFQSDQKEYLIQCGLGPIAYAVLSQDNGDRSASVDEAIVSADLTARVIYRQMRKAVRTILTSACEAGIDVVLLKGISIAHEFYELPYHRIMGDVDVLVRKDSALALQEILKSLGFATKLKDGAPGTPPSHHHLPPQRNENLGVTVEVHTQLLSDKDYSKLRLFEPDFFLQQTRAVEFDGVRCAQFTLAYQLVHVLTHWALDGGWTTNVISINDVIHLVNRNNGKLEWQQIAEWMRENHAFAETLTVLFLYLEKCGLIDLPETLLPKIHAASNRIGGFNIRILYWLMRTFPLSGRRKVAWAISATNARFIWRTMLEPRPKYLRFSYVVVLVIFRRHKGKSYLASIPGRIRTLLQPND